MRALDGLGLDVQQAVISCFNGFALDVFKAEVHMQLLSSLLALFITMQGHSGVSLLRQLGPRPIFCYF